MEQAFDDGNNHVQIRNSPVWLLIASRFYLIFAFQINFHRSCCHCCAWVEVFLLSSVRSDTYVLSLSTHLLKLFSVEETRQKTLFSFKKLPSELWKNLSLLLSKGRTLEKPVMVLLKRIISIHDRLKFHLVTECQLVKHLWSLNFGKELTI